MKISNLVKKILPQSAFVRGVSVLVGGTAGAQALMVLASPLLTRLYTPEDFGLLAVYGGLLALFTVVASLRYELAIPLPECNAEAANVLILSLISVCIMTSICSFMILLAGEEIAMALDTPQLAQFFWLLPIGVFLSGVYNLFNYWAIRTKTFSDIAKTQISQTLTTLVIQLFGYKFGGIALMFGQAGGQGMGSVRLARSAFKHKEFSHWTWRGVWQAAKCYKQFPMFSTWTGLFNVAGTQLPPLLFASLYTASAAGLFALAHRVLAMPISILGGAVGNVFFANAANAHRNNELDSLVSDVHAKLVKIAMPITLILVFFAPLIFSFVFGENWRLAGEIAQWMAPWLYFQFISSPLSSIFAVLNSENKTMLFQGGVFFARLACIFYGGIYLDLIQTVSLFSLVSAFLYVLYLAWIFKSAGLSLFSFVIPNMKAVFLISPPFIVFCFFHLVLDFSEDVLAFFILTLFYIFLYYLFLIFKSYR